MYYKYDNRIQLFCKKNQNAYGNAVLMYYINCNTVQYCTKEI